MAQQGSFQHVCRPKRFGKRSSATLGKQPRRRGHPRRAVSNPSDFREQHHRQWKDRHFQNMFDALAACIEDDSPTS
jgi:hypothetical protein